MKSKKEINNILNEYKKLGSANSVSKALSIDIRTILKYLRKNGIYREYCKKRFFSQEQRKEITNLYKIKSAKDIAQIFDVEQKTILRLLREKGIGVRKQEETRILKGIKSHRKGLSWEDEYGEKKAEELREIQKLNLPKRIKALNLKPNKPEKIMINIIKENKLPFNYVGDGQIIIGGFCPDFLSKNPKQIIEVFGDYWHNLPRYKEADKRRVETYARYGYKTLVIWEHELKNPLQVLDKINSFLLNRKDFGI